MAEQGFGCMGWSAFYKTCSDDAAVAVFEAAVAKGVVLFNTATFYGPLNEAGYGTNLRVIKKCLAKCERSKVKIMCKICMDTKAPAEKTGQQWILRTSPAEIMADVDYALEQLGTEYLDTIVLCRSTLPEGVEIEDVVAGMAAVVKAGKAKEIGLSEASAATIRRAHKVHTLACIEQEWSLWARDLEIDVVPTCRELGVKIVAYSPLGRGFLSGTLRDRNDPTLWSAFDFRVKMCPKFAEDKFDVNLSLVDAAKPIADKNGCTMAQLSLAWLHAQGPDVIPIPGTGNVEHLEENLKARDIVLSAEDLAKLNEIFAADKDTGDRYPHQHNTFHKN
mmetsp:Transcript_60434/g.88495  ORF Transcript_60434/g.88495 Transcript_60434/m.88495 type:complete len:334 (-) Transcript_60434:316-1317(-)